MQAEGQLPRRQFVRIGPTEWHLRRAGSGLPVLLLADPPLAGRSLLALVRALSNHAEAIAVDLPGLGDSRTVALGALEEDPLVAGIAAVADALDLGPFILFAAGASVPLARRIAAWHPHRVRGLALLDAPPDDEDWDNSRLAATDAIAPSSSGSHLAELWTQLRDKARFRGDRASRTGEDRSLAALPTPGVLTIAALDHLQGMAAARGVIEACLLPGDAEIRHPACLLSSEPEAEDPMIPVASPTEIAAAILGLAAQAGETVESGPQPLTLSNAVDPDYPVRRMVQTGGPTVHLIEAGTGTAPVILWLADAFSSALAARPMLTHVPTGHTMIAMDLPGIGDTPAYPGDPPGLITWATTAVEALDAAGYQDRPLVVAGSLWSAAVALQLAAARPERVSALYLGIVPILDEAVRLELRRVWPEVIAPDWSGSHLFHHFHRIRDREFQWPSFNPGRPFRRPVTPELDPWRLNRALIDQLKSEGGGFSLALSVLAAPVPTMARAVTCPVIVETDGRDPIYAGNARALTLLRDSHGMDREADPARLVQRLALMADQVVD